MHARLRILPFLLLLVAGGVLLLADRPVAGDAVSHEAEREAVAQGRALWTKVWRRGAKPCAACHGRGPNLLTADRLKAYPKYDKEMRRVVTGQQKLNHMIKTKAGGQPLELGSDELNALEAYVSTLE